jgi:type VI secretion system protein ImpG
MKSVNLTLNDYFRAELHALRKESLLFSEKHPELGRTFGINAREATDPQVELLLQSFAFLSARLHHQVERDKATLPNALLAFLYPHLEAPIPSMLIAQIEVKPDGADFWKEQVFPRGRTITAAAANHLGQNTECRFLTCYDTPLIPLKIESITLEAAAEFAFLNQQPGAKSVLRIRLRPDGVGALHAKEKGPGRLRFFINDAGPSSIALYELLALHLSAIGILPSVSSDDQQPIKLLPPDALNWLGMHDDEAVLNANPHTHPGYRLLQEYFSFPEKFQFFEVTQLDQLNFSMVDQYIDLLLILNTPWDPAFNLSSSSLSLNCVPLVNLYSQRIEPITISHDDYEYHLKGDLKNHRYCEIYAIEELASISKEGVSRQIAPYFAMDQLHAVEKQDYFYLARRQPSSVAQVAGSEMYIAFLDKHFSLGQLTDEVVGGRALCTNRRLPERLMSGSPMYLEGASPAVKSIRALTKPTPYHTTLQLGQRPWSLVSQLALNHLSLDGGPLALSALKDILRLHLGSNQEHGRKQIDAITELRSRTIMRHIGQDGWRGFVRGSGLTMVMDASDFGAGSPVLFCSVLRQFVRMYASVNHLVEVDLETANIKGVQKQWPAMSGVAMVL